MVSSPHQFVTVDMRDLKVALLARARSERASVSSVVRRCVAAGLSTKVPDVGAVIPDDDPGARIRVSIEMTPSEARQFFAGAKRAGLTRAAYLAELTAGAPVFVDSQLRREQLAMLASINSELSTLSRNLRHLAELLSHGSLEAASEYWGVLQNVADDVQRHLSASAGLLTELRARRGPGPASHRTVRSRRRQHHA